jgi:tRNA-2-methylthio-N6-dimethylallyladenosine synthase
MSSKRLYIHTIGCQMNVYDSEHMAMTLASLGYTPALSDEDADLIIVNTCSVRDKAEQKAFSILGRLEAIKHRRPGLIVGVAGCVAQQEGKRIFKRVPHVDIVIGTRALQRLPAHVLKVEAERCRVVDLEMTPGIESLGVGSPAADGPGVSRFVTIMRGCDNFCSYCVVPHVRGREVSRAPESIVQEVTDLVAAGKREVTLLGQNVNSYGTKEGLCSFSELLARVSEVDGLLRIRFTTSHPKDLTRDLMQSFVRIDKLCPHIHLPVQSGSNRLLERMNRSYTREHYLDNVFKLRDTCPEIAITSDMIVGFPGETDADFKDTLDLVREVEFDGLFAFMYSDRPSAPAAQLPGKVPAHLKRERLHALLQLQETFTYKKNAALVGSVQEILAEGVSKKQAGGPAAESSVVQWTGRTPGNKIVNFNISGGSATFETASAGMLVRVRIEKALAHSLWGAPENAGLAAGGPKGDACHAA